jgi:protein phosphatase
MEQLARISAEEAGLPLATAHKVIKVTRPESEEDGIQWWLDLTSKGREGMVVKPLDWLVTGTRGHVHPAVKCRGRGYLENALGDRGSAAEPAQEARRQSLLVSTRASEREALAFIERVGDLCGQIPFGWPRPPSSSV